MPMNEHVEAEKWVISRNLKLSLLHLLRKLLRHASPRDLLLCHVHEPLHLNVFAWVRLVSQKEVVRVCVHLFGHLNVLREINN